MKPPPPGNSDLGVGVAFRFQLSVLQSRRQWMIQEVGMAFTLVFGVGIPLVMSSERMGCGQYE